MARTTAILPLILPALVSLSSVGYAQTETRPAPAPPAPEHRLTVLWAPLRLVVPLVELTVEYRVADKIGASITLGGGKRTLSTGNNMDVPGNELEGGAQARYYALGDFSRGVELGAELLYERVRFDEPLPAGVVGVAAGGLTVGPFVGYKVATKRGFTFEGQLGARYLVVEPPVQGSAAGMPAIESTWLPLLHLNVGWSF